MRQLCYAVLLIGIASTVLASSETRFREKNRVQSPNNAHEAILFEGIVGATVSTPYKVTVGAFGEPGNPNNSVLLIDKSDAPKIHWRDDTHLIITCQRARVWEYRNFLYLKIDPESWEIISIELLCGNKGFPE